MPVIGAYVFIECGDDPAQIVKKVQNIAGVKQSHALFGPIEAIAYVEGKDLTEVEQIVLKIHEISGVKNTDTRICRLI